MPSGLLIIASCIRDKSLVDVGLAQACCNDVILHDLQSLWVCYV